MGMGANEKKIETGQPGSKFHHNTYITICHLPELLILMGLDLLWLKILSLNNICEKQRLYVMEELLP